MSELENHDYDAVNLEIENKRLQAQAAAMREALPKLLTGK